jgi:protein-tyrosine phosphatase
MAGGILKKMLADGGIEGITVLSAGTAALDGMPATDLAVSTSADWGIDLSGHRSQPVTDKLVEEADLILTMTPEHREEILSHDPAAAAKTFLLKGFPGSGKNDPSLYVRDPIGGGPSEYQRAFLEIEESLRRIFSALLQKAGKR